MSTEQQSPAPRMPSPRELVPSDYMERHRADAADMVPGALRIDPRYRTMIDDESDFDPLRTDPDFLALTSIIV